MGFFKNHVFAKGLDNFNKDMQLLQNLIAHNAILNEEIELLCSGLEPDKKGNIVAIAINQLMGEAYSTPAGYTQDDIRTIVTVENIIMHDDLTREVIVFADLMCVKLMLTIKNEKDFTFEEEMCKNDKLNTVQIQSIIMDIKDYQTSSLNYFQELLKKYYLRTMQSLPYPQINGT